jgi:hypothetical protein
MEWALKFPFRATMLAIVKKIKPELEKQGKIIIQI